MKGGPTMNVVIYARYSSHNQNDQSIEGQIANVKNSVKEIIIM